jgi:hypothetical protein
MIAANKRYLKANLTQVTHTPLNMCFTLVRNVIGKLMR